MTDPPFEAVVLTASLGGAAALQTVLRALPGDFPVPVLVVQHRAGTPDLLPALLAASAAVPVRAAEADALPATPGVHVLAPHPSSGSLAGPTLRRQADDVLTASAQAYAGGVCAVVLTGRLDDGARGVRAVKRARGMVLVESPATARASGMPTAAIATGCVDLVLPLRVMGSAVVALTMAPGAAAWFATPPQPWADLASA